MIETIQIRFPGATVANGFNDYIHQLHSSGIIEQILSKTELSDELLLVRVATDEPGIYVHSFIRQIIHQVEEMGGYCQHVCWKTYSPERHQQQTHPGNN